MRLVKRISTLASVAAVAFGLATVASAENTSLRIQTHFTAESMSGKMVAEFIENVVRCQMMKSKLRCSMAPLSRKLLRLLMPL